MRIFHEINSTLFRYAYIIVDSYAGTHREWHLMKYDCNFFPLQNGWTDLNVDYHHQNAHKIAWQREKNVIENETNWKIYFFIKCILEIDTRQRRKMSE